MASRSCFRLFQNVRPRLFGPARGLASKPIPGPYRSSRFALLKTIAVGVTGYGSYKYFNKETLQEMIPFKAHTVSAAAPPKSQPSVWTADKEHHLYLWIEVNPRSSHKEVAKVAARLQKMVDKVSDPSTRDERDEILAGVGFGPRFYKQVIEMDQDAIEGLLVKIGGQARKDYTYIDRKGANGAMPKSDGDIFVHAKCNTFSKLFELAQLFIDSLPHCSVEHAEDIYGFVYKDHRDLSGFIDGTENPSDPETRKKVAVEMETGGSYVVTQKWIHDMGVIHNTDVKVLENWIGRTMSDSTELAQKPVTAHIARVTGGNAFKQPSRFEIVRQSLPFGTVMGDKGLFFIAYAASPENFSFMLDRMVGASDDHKSDDLMLLSRNVKGTFWYFPGVEELKHFE